jgi:hypothetical protein
VSGEICSFAQEEEPPGLSNRQLQQTTVKNMTRMHLTGVVAISVGFIDTLTFKLNGNSRITEHSYRKVGRTHSTGFIYLFIVCAIKVQHRVEENTEM